MADSRWNRAIYEEFVSLAFLTERDLQILNARLSRWTQVEMCQKFHLSQSTVTRTIKKLQEAYKSAQKYSEILPKDLKI